VHAYGDNIAFIRGKSIRIVSKRPAEQQKDLQVFSVDGEVLWFTDFVQYDVEFEGLEVLVDF